MVDTTTRARPRANDTFPGADTQRNRDMSRDADETRREDGDSVTERLKSVGVDTEVMASTAKEQASELQRMLGDEMRTHPMRTLGIAAAVGLFVGLLTAR